MVMFSSLSIAYYFIFVWLLVRYVKSSSHCQPPERPEGAIAVGNCVYCLER